MWTFTGKQKVTVCFFLGREKIGPAKLKTAKLIGLKWPQSVGLTYAQLVFPLIWRPLETAIPTQPIPTNPTPGRRVQSSKFRRVNLKPAEGRQFSDHIPTLRRGLTQNKFRVRVEGVCGFCFFRRSPFRVHNGKPHTDERYIATVFANFEQQTQSIKYEKEYCL